MRFWFQQFSAVLIAGLVLLLGSQSYQSPAPVGAIGRQFSQVWRERLAPEQTYIHRQYSFATTTKTAWTDISGTALTGYPAQSAAYTVSGGKTFYLYKWSATVDSTTSVEREYGVQLSIGGVGTYWLGGRALTESRSPSLDFSRPVPIAAGSVITFQYRSSNVVNMVIILDGIEE